MLEVLQIRISLQSKDKRLPTPTLAPRPFEDVSSRMDGRIACSAVKKLLELNPASDMSLLSTKESTVTVVLTQTRPYFNKRFGQLILSIQHAVFLTWQTAFMEVSPFPVSGSGDESLVDLT